MGTGTKGTVIRIVALVGFALMLCVNVLANALPLNGVTTGEVSDAYPNLFAPAAVTFSIWGVIYLLLGAYTLYQLGAFRGGKGESHTDLLNQIGIVFSISSLANAAWIFSWHFGLIPLSMLLIAAMLLCMIFIARLIAKEELSAKETWLVRIPFSVYFGWLTIATVANATVLLVSLGWDGFGVPAPVWTVAVLIVAMLIGAATMLKNRDAAYGLVFLWAYAGILIRHVSAGGFSGRYPAVVAATLACLALMLVAWIAVLLPRRKKA